MSDLYILFLALIAGIPCGIACAPRAIWPMDTTVLKPMDPPWWHKN